MQQHEDRPIVILTGAGISKESGLETFRDPDGIWATVRIDLSTHDAGGVTDLDFQLAAKMNELLPS